MADVSSDAGIEALLIAPKEVVNPKARPRQKAQHFELDYNLRSTARTDTFVLFLRQSLRLDDDFTCGLRWECGDGTSIILARYNGSSHPHRNRLEGDAFVGKFHIHRATARYMAIKGGNSEHFAIVTDAYASLFGGRSNSPKRSATSRACQR